MVTTKGLLLQALAGVERWAMHRPTFDRLMQLAERGSTEPDAVKAVLADRMEVVSMTPPPGVALIPIHGIIEPRRSFWTEYFGGTSIEGLRLQFRKALDDEAVKGIVFHICSPGGDAVGVEEMATEIRNARGQKPMTAVCDCRAASAAYWLGCGADEFVGLQAAADCGSIGCFSVHFDWSKFNEDLGVKPSYIFAGRFKVEGNPDEPLSDEARAHYQAQVDDIYARFVASVAKGRGVTPARVKADFGEGRCFMVPQAVSLGMLDRQATMDDVIARAATGRIRRRAATEEYEKILRAGVLRPSDVKAQEDAEQADMVEPDEDGTCPDGYEKGEDGMCHLKAPGEMPDDEPESAAAATATDTPPPAQAGPSPDDLQRDRDWLDAIG